MADRDVAVRLSADVAAYVAGMEKAAASTKALGTSAKEAQASGAAMGRATQKAGSNAAAASAGMATFGRAGKTAAASAESAGKGAAAMGAGMASTGRSASAAASGAASAGAAAAGAGTRMGAAAAAGGRFKSGIAAAGTAAANAGRSFLSSQLGIAGFAAAVIAPVKASMDLEAAMSKVKATGAVTASQMNSLKSAAMSMGSTFGVSGTQAMSAVEELIKAGVSAKDVMGGGLQGALSLAAAGEMDVGDAAESAASAMTQFGLSGKSVPHIADLFAQAANLAQGSAEDISQAFANVGSVAAAAGLSIEQTTGFLGEMASNGHTGAEAGTQFKSMLLALQNPAGTAAKTMKKYGFEVNDANGHMKSLDGIAAQMHKSFDGLTDAQRNSAMATIFGNYGIQAARDLYKGGAAGVDEWTKNVSKSGAAQQVASKNLENLKGDLQKFAAAWTNAFANIGSDAQSPLRGVVQNLTDLAGVVERNQGTVVTLGKIAGALLALSVAAAGISKVVGGMKAIGTLFGMFKGAGAARGAAASMSGVGTAIEGVGGKAGVAGGKVGGFKSALGGLATGIPGLIVSLGSVAYLMAQIHGAQNTSKEQNALGSAAQQAEQAKIGTYDLNAAMKTLDDDGVGPLKENLNGLGDAMDHATGQNLSGWAKANDALGGANSKAAQARGEFSKFDVALASLAQSHNWSALSRNWKQIADTAKAHNISDSQLMKLFPQVQQQLGGMAKQLSVTGLSAKDYADWMGGKVPSSVNRAAVANSALAKSLGIIPDKKRVDVETKIKGGTKEQVAALNKELLKVPANKQSTVLATAKTKGYKEAMAQAHDFEMQAKGLQKTTSKEVKFEFKEGTNKDKIAAFMEQVKNFPAKQQKEISYILQTKGDAAAEKRIRELQATTRTVRTQYVTVNVKYITQDQKKALEKAMAPLNAEQQKKVKVTLQTQGYDQAMAQIKTFALEAKGLQQYTRQGLKIHIAGNTDPAKVTKLREEVQKLADTGELSQKQLNQISIDADTKGLASAERDVQAFNALVGNLDNKKITVTFQEKGKKPSDIEGEWTKVKGQRYFIPIEAPNAEGVKAKIDGIAVASKKINGKMVWVPVTQNGAPQVQNALMGVSSAADLANGKSVTIPSSAPGASPSTGQLNGLSGAADRANGKSVSIPSKTPGTAASTGLLNGLRAAWQRITGKSVSVHSSAPGASAAAGQISGLRAQANATNGKHVEVTAHADTSAARSALHALEAPLHTSLNVHVNMPHISVPTITPHIKLPTKADGGSIPGTSPTTTADNVPILATAGEFMHPVSAVRKYGTGFMEAVRTGRFPVERARGFAGGGSIGGQRLATGGLVGWLGGVASRHIIVQMNLGNTGQWGELTRAMQAQTKATVARQRASKAWNADRRRGGKNDKRLGEALNNAKQKEKDAVQAAQQAMESFAQAASSAAQSMSADFRKGGSVADLIANMSEGNSELKTFENQLGRLRNLGLSQSAIDAITGMGVNQGSALAGELLSGGKSMVASLNRVVWNLDNAADRLGRQTLAKFASGGTVTRPTLAVVGEAGAETIVPHTGSMAVQRWYEAGQAIGTLPASSSPYSGSATSGGGTTTVIQQMTSLPDRVTIEVPGLGQSFVGLIHAENSRTARNVARSRR